MQVLLTTVLPPGLRKEISSLRDLIREKDAMIAALSAAAAMRSEALWQKGELIASKDAEIRSLNAKLARSRRTIDRLTAEVQTATNSAESAHAVVKSLETERDRLMRTSTAVRAANITLERRLAARQAEADDLRATLDSMRSEAKERARERSSHLEDISRLQSAAEAALARASTLEQELACLRAAHAGKGHPQWHPNAARAAPAPGTASSAASAAVCTDVDAWEAESRPSERASGQTGTVLSEENGTRGVRRLRGDGRGRRVQVEVRVVGHRGEDDDGHRTEQRYEAGSACDMLEKMLEVSHRMAGDAVQLAAHHTLPKRRPSRPCCGVSPGDGLSESYNQAGRTRQQHVAKRVQAKDAATAAQGAQAGRGARNADDAPRPGCSALRIVPAGLHASRRPSTEREVPKQMAKMAKRGRRPVARAVEIPLSPSEAGAHSPVPVHGTTATAQVTPYQGRGWDPGERHPCGQLAEAHVH